MTVSAPLHSCDIRDIDEGLTPPDDVPTGLNGAAKRGLDLLIAIPLLLFTLPLIAAIAIAIRSQGKGPVIFRQTRCGRAGKAFTVYKFRTMHIDAPQALRDLLERDPKAAAEWEKNQKLQHDPRITRIGRFLRRSSLDELPQLINIIRGEMSVVGPRPVTFQELPRYGSRLAYYAAARPGVTGLWQVNGRSKTSYAARIAFDAAYAKGWTLNRDFYILLRTVPAVLFSRGAV